MIFFVCLGLNFGNGKIIIRLVGPPFLMPMRNDMSAQEQTYRYALASDPASHTGIWCTRRSEEKTVD
jgi:hypothetical protein